jgi:uncharacterized protein DUF2330
VNLLRTSTLAGYHDGVEHYVTSFEFAGGGGEFGSIVPLPGIPSNVERGGDWTLQRLVRETRPPVLAFSGADNALAAPAAPAEVLIEKRIDALDITVLRGGAVSVGQWAKDHGFLLPPDAPEVLDFYAKRSPIFMAARFDAEAAKARGQDLGDGTPIHLTIPTESPWVPLRILGLGKQAIERVQADVYLLTDMKPKLQPRPFSPKVSVPDGGMFLQRSEQASQSLITDLRADKGGDWIPASGMWLSYLRIDASPTVLTHDLAIDPTGKGEPSLVAAGLAEPQTVVQPLPDPGPVIQKPAVKEPVAKKPEVEPEVTQPEVKSEPAPVDQPVSEVLEAQAKPEAAPQAAVDLDGNTAPATSKGSPAWSGILMALAAVLGGAAVARTISKHLAA